MSFRTIKMINIIGIFLISFLFHQLYEWFPNRFFAIFFPVNESIFEHLKMIFSAVIFWMIIEYFLLKNKKYSNFILASLISSLSTIIFFLILFLPIYNVFGHDLLITLIIYFIAIILGQIISFYILTIDKYYDMLNLISLLLIPIIFIIFGYFTYNPIKIPLFYDSHHNKYGIYNSYN
jgi:hypothetical protein